MNQQAVTTMIYHFKLLRSKVESSESTMFYKRNIVVLLSLFFFINIAHTQQLPRYSTWKWSNSYKEWTIQDSLENNIGEIRMTWQLQNNWLDWSIDLNRQVGRLKVKYQDNPNQWDFRIGKEIININTVFPNQFNEWILSDGKFKISIRSIYNDNLEAWEITDDKHGYFAIITSWQGEFRDWTIIDELDEAISPNFKIAMAYLPILFSLPERK
ncbi:MAG: hypothetical protein AAFO07_09255 [Bacteroidota bacterium]